MNVKLTTSSGKEVLVNWESVNYVRETTNHFGESYTEIYFGKNNLDVKESVEEVEAKLHNQSR